MNNSFEVYLVIQILVLGKRVTVGVRHDYKFATAAMDTMDW